jgi:NADPH:quinone reductase-like Zn-dependent oxidoreductase
VRHEEYGVFAAVADAYFTGNPVVVCGTAGPGVTHLFTGLMDARKGGRAASFNSRNGGEMIRLAATSVNSIDIKIREGALSVAPPLPALLGSDIAGTFEQVGEDVSGFSVGDEVYGCAGGVKGLGGTLAEYIVADARLIALKPKTLSMRQAAALPLVSITAAQAFQRVAPSFTDHCAWRHGRCRSYWGPTSEGIWVRGGHYC